MVGGQKLRTPAQNAAWEHQIKVSQNNYVPIVPARPVWFAEPRVCPLDPNLSASDFPGEK
jgi:hypothetical protein